MVAPAVLPSERFLWGLSSANLCNTTQVSGRLGASLEYLRVLKSQANDALGKEVEFGFRGFVSRNLHGFT